VILRKELTNVIIPNTFGLSVPTPSYHCNGNQDGCQLSTHIPTISPVTVANVRSFCNQNWTSKHNICTCDHDFDFRHQTETSKPNPCFCMSVIVTQVSVT